jgi:hypothetical protein
MSNTEKREEVILENASIHHGDIHKDDRFDCENNCPYCNNEVVNIKLQYVLPVYDFIEFAEIYRNFRCELCDKEFWEVWDASADDYSFPDDNDDYLNEFDDYTDAYYDDRYDAYCKAFEQAIKTGDLALVGSYSCTVITPPVNENKYASELSSKYQYPVYRSLPLK